MSQRCSQGTGLAQHCPHVTPPCFYTGVGAGAGASQLVPQLQLHINDPVGKAGIGERFCTPRLGQMRLDHVAGNELL